MTVLKSVKQCIQYYLHLLRRLNITSAHVDGGHYVSAITFPLGETERIIIIVLKEKKCSCVLKNINVISSKKQTMKNKSRHVCKHKHTKEEKKKERKLVVGNRQMPSKPGKVW